MLDLALMPTIKSVERLQIFKIQCVSVGRIKERLVNSLGGSLPLNYLSPFITSLHVGFLFYLNSNLPILTVTFPFPVILLLF